MSTSTFITSKLLIPGTVAGVIAMPYMAAQADALSDGNGVTSGLDRNAIAHAITSAKLSLMFGANVTEASAQFHEFMSQGSGTDMLSA